MNVIKSLLFVVLCISIFFNITSSSSGINKIKPDGCGGSGCHVKGNPLMSLTHNGNVLSRFYPGQKYVLILGVFSELFDNNPKANAGFTLSASSGVLKPITLNSLVDSNVLYSTAPILKPSNSRIIRWAFEWTGGDSDVDFSIQSTYANGDSMATGDEWGFTSYVSLAEAPNLTIKSFDSLISENFAILKSVYSTRLYSELNVDIEYSISNTNVNTASVSSTPIICNGSPVSAYVKIENLLQNSIYYYRYKAKLGNKYYYSDYGYFKTLGTGQASISNPSGDFNETIKSYYNSTSNTLEINNKGKLNINNVRVVSMDGKVVKFPNRLKLNDLSLNLQDFSKGKYILIVEFDNDNKTYSNSFVIQ